MRIYEITDKNASWKSLNNVDLESIESAYLKIFEAYDIANRLHRKSMNDIITAMIAEQIELIDRAIGLKYPDPADIDIANLNSKLSDYKINLQNLYQKLT